MKYLILLTLTICLQLTICDLQRNYRQVNDYGDDADPNAGFEEEYDEPKPIYNLNDARNLFNKFIRDYNKKYKDSRDRETHYNNFVRSLKQINALNSDKTRTSTSDINMFSDLSQDEKGQYGGIGDPAPSNNQAPNPQQGFFDEPPGSAPLRPIVYQNDFSRKSFHHQNTYVSQPQKPVYKLNDAPKLFEQFVKDYNKVYKDENDRQQHYKTFVETLKEINDYNSDHEISDTFKTDISADLSLAEKHSLLDSL